MNRAISLFCLGVFSAVHGGETDVVRVGLGASAVSRYPGSDEVAVLPAALVLLQHGPWRLDTITYRTPFAGVSLEAAGGDVEFVAGAAARAGRDEDAGDLLQGQPEIDPTLAAAASLAWAPGRSLAQVRIQGVQDVLGAEQGLALRGELFLRAPPMRHLLVQAGAGLTCGDRRHMQTWFGARGGTPAQPGQDSEVQAGLRSTLLVLEGLVPLAGGWEGVFQVETSWLQRDAAASPLTARRQQLDATIGLAYRF